MGQTEAGETTRKCPKHLVCPIIFLPGIMGTRLRRTASGEVVQVWEASESQAKSWYLGEEEDPDWRRENFVGAPTATFSPNYLQVNTDSSQMGTNVPPYAVRRNWGGLAWRSYGTFMMWLHGNLKNQLVSVERAFANTEFQIWAHPYNWTDDNANSAKKLKATVAAAIKEAEAFADAKAERTAVKPILVTHSMGGLVARAYATTLGCADDVQAIIHGAMPTHGSPAAYKRMRAGNESDGSIAGHVGREYLGWDATQVTAVLGSIPGGLELLPNQYHTSTNGSDKWLYLTHTTKGDIKTLPVSDAFSEIYSDTSSWWRLVNPALLNPAQTSTRQIATARMNYLLLLMGTVYPFHANLNAGGDFHPTTYMFYNDRRNHLCWDHVEWKLDDFDEDAQFVNNMRTIMTSGDLPDKDDLEGTLEFISGTNYRGLNDVEAEVVLQDADAAGDGTVHAGSGLNLPAAVISEPTPGATFSHEEAYGDRNARIQVRDWIVEIMADELICEPAADPGATGPQ